MRSSAKACTTHSLLLRDARSQWSSGGFDLLVLDVGLPTAAAWTCAARCAPRATPPVLMLSARGERAGPRARPGAGRRRLPGQTFQPRANWPPRPRPAAPRRNPGGAGATATTAFCDDRSGQRILLHNQPLPLTRREYRCCHACWRAQVRIHARDALLSAAWGDESDSQDRTVDTHIKTLRAKLREADQARVHRHAPGMGYCLEI